MAVGCDFTPRGAFRAGDRRERTAKAIANIPKPRLPDQKICAHAARQELPVFANTISVSAIAGFILRGSHRRIA